MKTSQSYYYSEKSVRKLVTLLRLGEVSTKILLSGNEIKEIFALRNYLLCPITNILPFYYIFQVIY